MKTEGQKSYERECKMIPNYHDGTRRKSWDELCDQARANWEAKPSMRFTSIPKWANGESYLDGANPE